MNEAIARFGGPAVRLFYLRAHYRSPLEFSEDLLNDAKASLDRVARLMGRSTDRTEPDASVIEAFTVAMDDDFATPEALGVLFEAVRDANRLLDEGAGAGALLAAVEEILSVLGLDVSGGLDLSDLEEGVATLVEALGIPAPDSVSEALDAVVVARTEARAARDWSRADEIRDGLAEIGIVVEDGPDGSRWYRR